MEIDFTKTSIEYNEGFIDGLLWGVNRGNKPGIKEIIRMVKNIRKANDNIISEDEKRFEQLKRSEVIKNGLRY